MGGSAVSASRSVAERPRLRAPRSRRRTQSAGRETLGATRAGSWLPQLACEDVGCLDWMPEPAEGTSLYGYVVDHSKRQPVVDALVVATELASGRKAQATTNALGQFFFGALAPGRYDVTVIRGASRDRWPGVVLDAGRRTALRIHMAPEGE